MFAFEPDDFDLMPMERRLKVTYGYSIGGMALVGLGASLDGLLQSYGLEFLLPVGFLLLFAGFICVLVGGVFGARYLYCAACGRRIMLIPWHRCRRCGTWLWGKRPPDLRNP